MDIQHKSMAKPALNGEGCTSWSIHRIDSFNALEEILWGYVGGRNLPCRLRMSRLRSGTQTLYYRTPDILVKYQERRSVPADKKEYSLNTSLSNGKLKPLEFADSVPV